LSGTVTASNNANFVTDPDNGLYSNNIDTIGPSPEGVYTTDQINDPTQYQFVEFVSNGGFIAEFQVEQYWGATLGSDGTLNVQGTDGADKISVDVDQDNSMVLATVNGTIYAFPFNAVKQIVVNTEGGDDNVQLTYNVDDTTADPPTTITGGDGNDTLDASLGGNSSAPAADQPSVFITAGSGNDSFNASGNGAVTMAAGNGTDQLGIFGNLAFTMTGGAGDDTFQINSPAATGTITAGTGSSTAQFVYQSQNPVTIGVSAPADPVNLVNIQNIDFTNNFQAPSMLVDASNSTNNFSLGIDGSCDVVPTINGGSGVDTITIDDQGDATVNAGAGNANVNLNGNEGTVSVSATTGSPQISLQDDLGANISFGSGGGSVSGSADSASVTATTGAITVNLTAINASIVGSSADDNIAATSNNLYINAEGGDDTIRMNGPVLQPIADGDPGPFVGGTILGGDGNDTIYAADNEPETIDGGAGDDTAYVDQNLDTVTNVENINYGNP